MTDLNKMNEEAIAEIEAIAAAVEHMARKTTFGDRRKRDMRIGAERRKEAARFIGQEWLKEDGAYSKTSPFANTGHFRRQTDNSLASKNPNTRRKLQEAACRLRDAEADERLLLDSETETEILLREELERVRNSQELDSEELAFCQRELLHLQRVIATLENCLAGHAKRERELVAALEKVRTGETEPETAEEEPVRLTYTVSITL